MLESSLSDHCAFGYVLHDVNDCFHRDVHGYDHLDAMALVAHVRHQTPHIRSSQKRLGIRRNAKCLVRDYDFCRHVNVHVQSDFLRSNDCA